MTELKILHLYYDLMNLYGDWANTEILARALTACGCKAVIDKKSIREKIDFKEYKFVYIGSGTEKNQQRCMQDIKRHKKTLLKNIEDGLFVMATGNSHELFGRSITIKDGDKIETLGLLDFETIQKNSRVTGDCVYTATFLNADESENSTNPVHIIGFVNRAGGGQFDIQNDADKKCPQPLIRPFTVKMGPSAGNGLLTEGVLYKNLLGTYLTGPILVRNPHILKYYTGKLTETVNGKNEEKSMNDRLFEQQEDAYNTALNELLRRV